MSFDVRRIKTTLLIVKRKIFYNLIRYHFEIVHFSIFGIYEYEKNSKPQKPSIIRPFEYCVQITKFWHLNILSSSWYFHSMQPGRVNVSTNQMPITYGFLAIRTHQSLYLSNGQYDKPGASICTKPLLLPPSLHRVRLTIRNSRRINAIQKANFTTINDFHYATQI